MRYFSIWLVINFVTAYDHDLKCPYTGQWELRARAKNCSNKENYICLFDAVQLTFDENCKGPQLERKGNKPVLNKGNFDRIQCSPTHYQPLTFFSFGNTNCTHLKSPCSSEGQVIADNGTSYGDRSCRCDYRQGYAFVNDTSVHCSCMPSKEDCTCYLKTCSVNEVLSPDYKCINKTDSQGGHQCSFIISGTESTVPETGIVPVNKSDRVSLSYTKGNKSIAACCIIVVFVVVVIIVFIILCVCYWEQTDRKIRQFWKALNKIIVTQTQEEEEQITLDLINVDKPEDIPGVLVTKDKDSSSDLKDLKGKHTTCYSPEDLKKCIKQSLVESSKQHAVEERLKQHCKFHGMEFLGRTPGNGNCFFEAISAQVERLKLPRKSAEDLRQEVSTYLQENPTYEANGEVVNLRDFVEVGDFMEYCESMSKNYVWADHVIVVTMARMLKQNIIIVTSSPETNQEDSLVWVHGGEECNEKPPLLIGHYWENHYQSLRPTVFQHQHCDEDDSVTITSDVGNQELMPHGDDSGTSCHVNEKDCSSELTVKEVSIIKPLEEKQLHFEGDKVTFTCEVDSEVILGKWFKDGQELSCSDNLDIIRKGRIREIVIHEVTDDDRGNYSFKIQNKTSGGLLVVLGKMATCSNEPRPTCLKENQNYGTLDRLLKDVAETVVRKRFDKEFDPTALQKTLNRESLKLKKLVNNKQWNILFPRDQKPVCSSDFDLTLMILLIRNLTLIQVSDILPVPNDSSQGADISRIKYYRNVLAHCNGKISDIEFEQQWVEICQALVRLGGESYKEICAKLKVTSLSSGKGYGMKIIIVKQLEDQSCNKGGSVTFTCEVNQNDIPARWSKNGQELKASESISITAVGNVHKIVIHSVTAIDSGKYACHINDKKSSAQLTVKEVTFINKFKDQQCFEGETVIFTCEVSQENVPGKWRKDGIELVSSESKKITVIGRTHNLVIHSVTLNDKGYYLFKVTDKASGAYLIIEDTKYIKLCHLLKTVAEPVIRKMFDREIHPDHLKQTLSKGKNKIDKLKKHKNINWREYDLLYPKVVEYSVKFKIKNHDYSQIQGNEEEDKRIRAEILHDVSALFNNVQGIHKVGILDLESGSLIAVIKLTASMASQVFEKTLKTTIESAVKEGKIGSFETDSDQFIFQKLGNLQVPITSQNFDIRLMMILMKNLIEAYDNISDVLPIETDITEIADLSRVKHIRNKIVQNSDRSISDEDFEEDWSNLSQALIRLGGESVAEECKTLKEYQPTPQQSKDYLNPENLQCDQGSISNESLTDDFVQETLMNNSARYAVRQIFDKQFPPQALQKEIENQKQPLRNLKEHRGITQSQWDDLFPREKESLSSARFDIKVMIILLSNTSFKDKEIFKTIENLQNCLSRPKEYRKAIMQAIKEINEEELSWR